MGRTSLLTVSVLTDPLAVDAAPLAVRSVSVKLTQRPFTLSLIYLGLETLQVRNSRNKMMGRTNWRDPRA